MFPQHRQIADDLRRKIAELVYPPGALLPPEGELAAAYGVSRTTIRHAVTTLRFEGLLDCRQGARHQVRRPVPSHSFTELSSFGQWATRSGHTPGGLILRRRQDPATPSEARLFAVEVGEPILHMLRVRTLDGEPIMVERTLYTPWMADAVQALPRDTPTITDALHERTGVVFHHGQHTIDTVAADDTDTALLEVADGTQLLRHWYVILTPDGRPFESSEDRYKPGTMAFTLSNSVGTNLVELLRRGKTAAVATAVTQDSTSAPDN